MPLSIDYHPSPLLTVDHTYGTIAPSYRGVCIGAD